MDKKIIIFTDGASKGNPGPGGWGAVIIENVNSKMQNDGKGKVTELGGREDHTTNNRMELSGAIAALEKIKDQGGEIVIYTDSKYLIGGMTEWIVNWQKNNWRTAQKKPVLNKDLWEKLSVLVQTKNVVWYYVAGHTGHPGNERCDQIASGLALKEEVFLYEGPLAKYSVKINISSLNG
jgi:ribonuclease HI